MGKLLVALIVLLAISVAGFFLLSGKSDISGSVILDDSGSNKGNNVDDVKVFAVDGGNFKFFIDGVENPDIRVKKGDRVRIEFNNVEGFHDWKVDEFNAATKQIKANETDSVEFIADKKGTFEYYCSVGKHREMGMKGRFIVE